MRKTAPWVLVIAFLSSCATFNADFNTRTDQEWSNKAPSPYRQVQHSIYLVGDAGNVNVASEKDLLFHLQNELQSAEENSSLIFLGDNIYPNGLPPKEDKVARADAEQKLMSQINILEDFSGASYIIPGNHDWRSGGIKAIKRQEKFVEKALGRGNFFLPDNACGDPTWVDLSDDLGMIVLDSEWWLSNWNKQPGINNDCDVKSRAEMMSAYLNLLKKKRDKVIIVAFHHPLFTNGPHGGNFAPKTHIFPLTEFSHNAWVPLPGLGSLYALLRKNVGVRQDLYGSLYNEFKQSILSSSEPYDNLIFVAGHEHTLQHHEAEGHHFIVSGAGAKASPARATGAARFTYGNQGFVRLDVYEDRSAWAHFYGLEDKRLKEIYRVQVHFSVPESVPASYDEFFEYKDSTTTTIYPGEEKTGLNRLLWGDLHRELYYQEVAVPSLNLEDQHGGLIPVRKGGGMQTNSLRLEDTNGKEYVLRALRKDASRLAGGLMEGTVLSDIMTDIYTFTHPYSAYVVPEMAEAAGVYHTNPQLVYLPKQPELGGYNDHFGGELYLYEKRIAGDHNRADHFGKSEKLISSYDFVEKHMKNNNHSIDEAFFIRNRIFDMFIGDWDRHEDQWRWATFTQSDGTKLYRPIPRDRDQAFTKIDGVAFKIARYMVPSVRQFQSFDHDIKDSDWYYFNTRFFDSYFTSGIEWSVWETQARALQQVLTDPVIESAIKGFPPLVFEATGEDIIAKLKSRRDKLPDIARRYYKRMAEKVDVIGTEKDDVFEVHRIDKQTTVVEVFSKNKKKQRYKRTFRTGETKEIHLWGLDGEDTFTLDGEVNKGVKIIIVGGLNDDVVLDKSKVNGLTKKTHVYDSPNGLTFDKNPELKDQRTTRRAANEFIFRDPTKNYNYQHLLPILSYNNDGGFTLGANYNAWRYGFKKAPYKQHHMAKAFYVFGTKGFGFEYDGEYNYALGENDLLVNAHYQTPRFTMNYFGAGNEPELKTDDLSYNRVRQSKVGGMLTLRRRIRNNSNVGLSLLFDEITIEKTTERFVSTTEANLPENIFKEQYFGGLGIHYFYGNVNDKIFPTQGFVLDTKVNWKADFKDFKDNFFSIDISMSMYNKLFDSNHFVYATKIGFKHVEGANFFYQNARLGGEVALRGYREDRLNAPTAFYQNSDLRIYFGELKTSLFPIKIGTNLSFDHGRVWLEEDESNKWHYTYGGDLWINIMDLALIRGGVHWSEEDYRISAGMKFAF
jgi:hypothetical protein